MNKYQEIVKEEVLKDTVQKEIKENFMEPFVASFNNPFHDKKTNNMKNQEKQETEDAIDDSTRKAQKEVKTEILEADEVKPGLGKKLFNRIYFSIITGCLLGYGDIYPVTIAAKTITMFQGLTTVALIIS